MATVSRAAAGVLVKQGYPTRIAATAVAAERRDRIIEPPRCNISRPHHTKKRLRNSRVGVSIRKTGAGGSLRATHSAVIPGRAVARTRILADLSAERWAQD